MDVFEEMISSKILGKTVHAKMHYAYLALQERMNAIFDQNLDRTNEPRQLPGLKQILEKKEVKFCTRLVHYFYYYFFFL